MLITNELLEKIFSVTKSAGDAIMGIYCSAKNVLITEKLDSSPVTEADLLSDNILKSGLKKVFDCPYLSEESADYQFDERQKWGIYWLVDPLDGTKEFLNKTNEFTINIALVNQTRLILGIVYAPALGVMY